MRLRVLDLVALASALTLAAAALAAPPREQAAFVPVSVDAAAGSTIALDHWEIQSSAKAQQGGAAISRSDFAPKDWFRVSGRATVMAGLLENGLYPDVFHSDNLRAVEIPDSGGSQFVVSWWYRTQFTRTHSAANGHTLLRTNGLIASADLWFNGRRVADRATLAGAYPLHEFDVTPWLKDGLNTVALHVYPDDPARAFTIGWVDWNPQPPDFNMGPWRGVDVVETGPVRIGAAQVDPALSLPALDRAALTVTVDLKNLSDAPQDVMLAGDVAGVALQREVHLAAGETSTLAFSPRTDAALDLKHPHVWWPVGLGDHPLYRLALTANVRGAVSDRASLNFGVRDVQSRLTPQGYREFLVNGKPVLIRGAGWAPDIFLRADAKRMATEFDYVLNLGLNTIRTEGKLEDQAFYDLADSLGVMILAGWECCDKWESWSGSGGEPWDDADRTLAAASMASEARLLRNHPSVIGFLIGSDYAPPPADMGKTYVDILRAANWPTPIVASASKRVAGASDAEARAVPSVLPARNRSGAGAYPSGMKMEGPYDWVPPAYWYVDTQLGGAFGFDSEVGAGATIPRLDDVKRMLSPLEQDALWKYPEVRQYHAADSWSPFATLKTFDTALAKRYGPPKDLADYVAKAQLDNYDNVRAQFEAFNAHRDAAKPATGVIYWMLNNAWPSLHWHLYDYYLNPAGAFFGAKKANEPVHIQYSYDTRTILLVNQTAVAQQRLSAHIRVRSLDGDVRFEKTVDAVDLAGDRTLTIATLPPPSGVSGAYFVELDLAAHDGHALSRNVYWLSTQADVLDGANSTWYLTPLTQYADLTALQSLPPTTVEVQATTRHEGNGDVATITLTLPASAKSVALFQHVALRQAAHGDFVVPVLWSDNDVTLWPGESITLAARYARATSAAPVLEVNGWNVPTQQVALAVPESAASAPGAAR